MSGALLAAAAATVVLVLTLVLVVHRTVRADRAVGEAGAGRLATWQYSGLDQGGRSDDDRWPL